MNPRQKRLTYISLRLDTMEPEQVTNETPDNSAEQHYVKVDLSTRSLLIIGGIALGIVGVVCGCTVYLKNTLKTTIFYARKPKSQAFYYPASVRDV